MIEQDVLNIHLHLRPQHPLRIVGSQLLELLLHEMLFDDLIAAQLPPRL